MTGFTHLPDLASRELAGSVCAANDEFFAARENLIKPEPPAAVPTFGHKGKEYDGWETRRRREPGADWAVVRLGVPGEVHGVVVDTAYFTGNYPPHVSVAATAVEGYPSPAELADAAWEPILAKSVALGDTANEYPVSDRRVWTHVRLTIHPDGGVARFRVHGVPVPDPRFLTGTIDLAALENGGGLVSCSNAFYGSAGRLILPGRARNMGDGWENARRRDDGHDWAVFRLAGAGTVRHVELDTSYFLGNAPGWVRLAGCRVADDGELASAQWFDVVPRVRSQPDARQRFLVEEHRAVTHVRLDVYPDGGMARLRVWGELVEVRGAPTSAGDRLSAGGVSERRTARSAPGR